MHTDHSSHGGRQEKVANFIREEFASFLSKTDSHTSLITVTHATVSPDLKRGTIWITVLPDTKAESALNFIKRNLGDFRKSLKENMAVKNVPFLEVALDLGEKNRQKIDELLREK